MAYEIVVEGEPWTGLLVVRNVFPKRGVGPYSLVQASEWKWTGDPKDPDRAVTVWRGPHKPDEKVKRKDLVEVECRTVHVDEDGFYTCPRITDELTELVEKATEPILNEMANRSVAESSSTVHEGYTDDFGEDVWIKAEYGDVVAINGDIIGERQSTRPPRGWVDSERGGYDPSGDDTVHEVEYVAEQVAREIEQETGEKPDQKTVEAILREKYSYNKDYINWTSSGGRTWVYVSKKALKDYEEGEGERKRAKSEREHREAMARREREAQERKRKIRAGGFPRPKDWSPTGEV